MSELFRLHSFQPVKPLYCEPQNATLEFLKDVHRRAVQHQDVDLPIDKFFNRYGIDETQISQRYFECEDFYLSPEKRRVYNSEDPHGSDIRQRAQIFHRRAQALFSEIFPSHAPEPEHLIHVTCTGYVSPSAAQTLVAERQWDTEITHAYHMGCYAALPAVRLAWGQSHLGKTVDIVHTEMCSLHSSPNEHTPEQIVVQTLFADGHIRYQGSQEKKGAGFIVHAIKEKVLPESSEDMVWMPAPWGMAMTLSRAVPQKIQAHIRDFTLDLLKKSGRPVGGTLKDALFAIHPGGPKIIEAVAQTLELTETQTASSRKILFTRGNMSSATLPHVWNDILETDAPAGTPVVSLAFGPGLTVFGSVFEVER